MNVILFAAIHILIGLALIYFYGKLPKTLTTFGFVFFVMSILYLAHTWLYWKMKGEQIEEVFNFNFVITNTCSSCGFNFCF